MAVLTPEKIKIPGEQSRAPSNPSNVPLTSPKLQTQADVKQSQIAAGKGPKPEPEKQGAPTNAPATPTTSSVIPQAKSTAGGGPKPTPTLTSAPQGATATVPTTTGAPPGVPLTTPSVGLAPTPKSIQGHNASEDTFLQAQNEDQQKLYEAALAYNGGPASALSNNALNAQEGVRKSTENRGAAGTIESSLFGEDKARIANALATKDTEAYETYQTAVTAANEALQKAQIAYAQATEQEKREIAEAAERRELTESLNPPPPGALPGATQTPTVISQSAQPPSKELFGGRSIVNPGQNDSYIVAANGEHYPNTEWNRDHPKQMRH